MNTLCTPIDPMATYPWLVKDVVHETSDTFTLSFEPETAMPDQSYAFEPGQFNMVYVFGVGEVPISICSDPGAHNQISHTTRIVGTVTTAMSELEQGNAVGIRGPFGTSWPVDLAKDKDVIIIAGGIGLAPLRPSMYHILNNRDDYHQVSLLYGARSQEDILYRAELEQWSGRLDVEVFATVDRGTSSWFGNVGVVTQLVQRAPMDPANSIVMICGPEIMMKYCIPELHRRGLRNEEIYVSVERNMKCAVGHCGHCQYGPEFVCKDGPVFRYDQVANLMKVEEL
jgi:NAD(P)H-flavin reductase